MARGEKTLAALGSLMGQQQAANEERLIAFLASYAAANQGATPAYAVMANQLGVVEEGVRILLARLENKGRIHFISRNPPRIMLVGKDMRLPHEPTATDMGLAKQDAAARFLDAEGERMRLGRYIATTIRDTGRAPNLADMQKFVGFGSLAYVRRMAEILAERGLIQYGHGVPTKLTEVGQSFFGVRPPQPKMEQAKMDTPANEQRPVVVVSPRRPRNETVIAMCKALADFKRDNDGGSPTYKELSHLMGYKGKGSNLCYVVEEALRRGWLKPRPPRSQSNLYFTEKGRARFMPETIEEGMPYDKAPEPAPAIVTAGGQQFEVQPGPEAEAPTLGQSAESYLIRTAPEPDAPLAASPAEQPQFHILPQPAVREYEQGRLVAELELARVDTLSLVMELNARGYTVRKG